MLGQLLIPECAVCNELPIYTVLDPHSEQEVKEFEAILKKRANRCYIKYPEEIARKLEKSIQTS